MQLVLPETYYSSVMTLQMEAASFSGKSVELPINGVMSHKTAVFINSALKVSNHMRLLVCKMGHNYGNVKKLKTKC